MEVVLLWLDDLDDLVFSGVLLWEGLRRIALQIGLAASITLAACEVSMSAAKWAMPFAGIAALCVTIWFAGAACVLAQRLDAARSLA